MDAAANLQPFAKALETALTGLDKLIRARSFYPLDHPSLVAASEAAYHDFQSLLQHQNDQPCHVTQEGFSLADVPLAPNNKSLADLALRLVERRVRQLLFLPDLSRQELLLLSEELVKPAAELLAEGGLAKKLEMQQISSILINQSQLAPASARQQGQTGHSTLTAAEISQPHSSPAAERPQLGTLEQMRERLEQLKEPQEDERYLEQLAKVRQFAPAFFRQTGVAGYLAIFTLLESQRKETNRPAPQRQAAEALVDQLLSKPQRKALVDALAEPKLKVSQRRALTRLLISLENRIAPQLLKRLYAERDAIVRRYYTAILAQMGEAIFALLRQDLHHETWHRVRNVVTILGESRNEAALPLIAQVLDYPEARVRRTVIRALAAIGSNSVIPLLLRMTQDTDEELHHPAILALGTLKNAQAIPPLVDILRKADPFGKKTALKIEVIQALATTRSPKAIIPLLKLARKLNLLNRKSVERLRAEAILALGQLGNDKLIPVLQQLPRTRKEPASRALQQAITQLRKQQHAA